VNLLPPPAARLAKGKDGEEKLSASDTGPFAAYVWKTTADPFVGKMTYFRLFSGASRVRRGCGIRTRAQKNACPVFTSSAVKSRSWSRQFTRVISQQYPN